MPSEGSADGTSARYTALRTSAASPPVSRRRSARRCARSPGPVKTSPTSGTPPKRCSRAPHGWPRGSREAAGARRTPRPPDLRRTSTHLSPPPQARSRQVRYRLDHAPQPRLLHPETYLLTVRRAPLIHDSLALLLASALVPDSRASIAATPICRTTLTQPTNPTHHPPPPAQQRRRRPPPVVVEGAHEHPPRKAVEALALLILGIVLASGCGVVEWVASPYTGVVHKVPPG